MRMYFVQIRRAKRALYWYIGCIFVILATTSIFGNVTIYGSVYRIFDYRPPTSHETLHVYVPFWSDTYTEVGWPAFPWGHAYKKTGDVIERRRPFSFWLPERHSANKIRTPVGTFVEMERVPRQRVVVHPNGDRHFIYIQSFKAPDGRFAQWHEELQIDGLAAFSEPVTAEPLVLTMASLLCTLLGVVMGVGLGDDVANHLSIVRTRPVGKTAFVASAIGIDIAFLTVGAAIMGVLLLSMPWDDSSYHGPPAVKLIAACLIWSFALACYGITLALTTASKRVTALVVLSAVAVAELIISSSIGYGLPRPLDALKPALDALNPINHYAIVNSNLSASSAASHAFVDSTVYNLGALIGLASVGMLVAILRWRAAKI